MKLAAVIAVVSFGCARETPSATPPSSSPPTPVAKVAVADPGLVGARERGHDVLSRDCGECHEGHRPTAKPPALAIFDLDKPDWQTRFDERRFEVAAKRFSSKPPADRDAFVAFRDAELAARRGAR